MAFTDDYSIVGAATDNFDCEVGGAGAVSGWFSDANSADVVLNTNAGRFVEGSGSLELRSSNNTANQVKTWYHDVTSGSRFQITSEDLQFWFNYSKGKGDNIIGTGDGDVTVRLFFGGTVDFADYFVASAGKGGPSGDDFLNFGWQLLQASGTNLNGGTPNFAIVAATAIVADRDYIITTVGTTDWNAVAGTTGVTYEVGDRITATQSGTGTGQASDTTDTDWNRDIFRVELRLFMTNANNDDAKEPALLMDAWFVGTKITVSEGTPASPIDETDIENYAKFGGTRSTAGAGTDFPLGLFDVEGNLINMRCGLDIGNGSDGTDNEGNVKINSKFWLNNQNSSEVKHNILVDDFSSLELGDKESGTDGTYAVRGVQMSCRANRNPDFEVADGAICRAFDTKFFRWRDLKFGGVSDTGSTTELRRVQIDTCKQAIFRSNTLELQDIETYNNSILDGIKPCGQFFVSPDECTNFLVHDCNQGYEFRGNVTITEYIAQDNDTGTSPFSDLNVLDGNAATLRNSTFDSTKIIRVTT